jgi:hypothetical protein
MAGSNHSSVCRRARVEGIPQRTAILLYRCLLERLPSLVSGQWPLATGLSVRRAWLQSGGIHVVSTHELFHQALRPKALLCMKDAKIQRIDNLRFADSFQLV